MAVDLDRPQCRLRADFPPLARHAPRQAADLLQQHLHVPAPAARDRRHQELLRAVPDVRRAAAATGSAPAPQLVPGGAAGSRGPRARDAVRDLLGNAASADEIVWTRNTTEALNIVAHGLAARARRRGARLVSASTTATSCPGSRSSDRLRAQARAIPTWSCGGTSSSARTAASTSRRRWPRSRPRRRSSRSAREQSRRHDLIPDADDARLADRRPRGGRRARPRRRPERAAPQGRRAGPRRRLPRRARSTRCAARRAWARSTAATSSSREARAVRRRRRHGRRHVAGPRRVQARRPERFEAGCRTTRASSARRSPIDYVTQHGRTSTRSRRTSTRAEPRALTERLAAAAVRPLLAPGARGSAASAAA